MLDVGGGRGALVVWMPPELNGSELEIRRQDQPWRGEHTAVRPRVLRAGPSYAAVFGTLAAGRYELRVRDGDGDRVVTAQVVGGSVADATWPTDRAPVPDPPSSPRTRSALVRRNLGQTSSLNPTPGSSVMMRSSESPMGK